VIDWTPSAIAIQLGPIPIYWYGVAYATGLAAGYLLMVRQSRLFGQDANLIGNGLIIVAAAALVGGRLYHVIDQWHLYADDPIKIILPPYTGLGVFGGFITGSIAFLLLARRYRVSIWVWGDIVTPALFVFQAVARWGNFFNQELYGRATDVPWGIAIDCAHRLPEYPCDAFPVATTHFHPLFLYESTSAVIGLIVVLWLSRNPPTWLKTGMLFPITLIWMGSVRFLTEFLRIDSMVWRLGGIPTAQLFGLGFVVVGVFLMWYLHRTSQPVTLVEADADDEDEDDWYDEDDEDDEGYEDDEVDTEDEADTEDAADTEDSGEDEAEWEADEGAAGPEDAREPLT